MRHKRNVTALLQGCVATLKQRYENSQQKNWICNRRAMSQCNIDTTSNVCWVILETRIIKVSRLLIFLFNTLKVNSKPYVTELTTLYLNTLLLFIHTLIYQHLYIVTIIYIQKEI